MKTILLHTFLVFLFCSICSGCSYREDSVLWGEIPVKTVNPEISDWISSEANEYEMELLFGQIGDIQADHENYFYVLDLISQSIKKMDGHGNLVQEIGRRGRGAGEFMAVKHFTIYENSRGAEELMISDEINRRIYNYSLEGEHNATHFPPAGLEFPSGPLTSVKTDNFQGILFLYKLPETARDKDCIFHLFKQDFSDKTTCFGSFSNIRYNRSDAFHYLTQARPGHFTTDSSKTIYYTPYLYDGSIYRYEFDDNRQQWAYTGILQGLVYQTKPIDENAEPYEYRLTYRGKSYFGRIANQSLGLFSTPTGLRHFTRIKTDTDESWYGMEKYNSDGVLESYIRITGIDPNNPDRSFPVLHQDTKGVFYLLNTEDAPEVKRFWIDEVF